VEIKLKGSWKGFLVPKVQFIITGICQTFNFLFVIRNQTLHRAGERWPQ